MELYNYTTSSVINYLVETLAENNGFTKAKAKQLLLNALTYNVVIEAIQEQVDFLSGNNEE